MFVKIAKLGSRVEEVMVEEGTTVGGALTTAGLSAEGFNIRLNRVDATVDTILHNGGDDVVNIITLLPAIKGGK